MDKSFGIYLRMYFLMTPSLPVSSLCALSALAVTELPLCEQYWYFVEVVHSCSPPSSPASDLRHSQLILEASQLISIKLISKIKTLLGRLGGSVG